MPDKGRVTSVGFSIAIGTLFLQEGTGVVRKRVEEYFRILWNTMPYEMSGIKGEIYPVELAKMLYVLL